jgi:hypothetical protein
LVEPNAYAGVSRSRVHPCRRYRPTRRRARGQSRPMRLRWRTKSCRSHSPRSIGCACRCRPGPQSPGDMKRMGRSTCRARPAMCPPSVGTRAAPDLVATGLRQSQRSPSRVATNPVAMRWAVLG